MAIQSPERRGKSRAQREIADGRFGIALARGGRRTERLEIESEPGEVARKRVGIGLEQPIVATEQPEWAAVQLEWAAVQPEYAIEQLESMHAVMEGASEQLKSMCVQLENASKQREYAM